MTGHTQKGICNLHDEFEEIEADHIGHNFTPKYCHLKLAGCKMKYWLYQFHLHLHLHLTAYIYILQLTSTLFMLQTFVSINSYYIQY